MLRMKWTKEGTVTWKLGLYDQGSWGREGRVGGLGSDRERFWFRFYFPNISSHAGTLPKPWILNHA